MRVTPSCEAFDKDGEATVDNSANMVKALLIVIFKEKQGGQP